MSNSVVNTRHSLFPFIAEEDGGSPLRPTRFALTRLRSLLPFHVQHSFRLRLLLIAHRHSRLDLLWYYQLWNFLTSINDPSAEFVHFSWKRCFFYYFIYAPSVQFQNFLSLLMSKYLSLEQWCLVTHSTWWFSTFTDNQVVRRDFLCFNVDSNHAKKQNTDPLFIVSFM